MGIHYERIVQRPTTMDSKTPQFCHRCQTHSYSGEWETFNNNRNRRWVCARCKPKDEHGKPTTTV